MAGSTATALPRPRLRWADSLRGACMILVVLLHVPGIATATPPPLFAAVYLFHLPCLFYLSGYLAPAWPLGPRQAASRALHRLIVPYFAYVAIFAGARVIARHLDGLSARTPQYLVRTFLFGGRLLSGHLLPLWFAPVLAFVQVMYAVLWRLVAGPPPPVVAVTSRRARPVPRWTVLLRVASVAVGLRWVAHLISTGAAAEGVSASAAGKARGFIGASSVTWMDLDVAFYAMPLYCLGHFARLWRWWVPVPPRVPVLQPRSHNRGDGGVQGLESGRGGADGGRDGKEAAGPAAGNGELVLPPSTVGADTGPAQGRLALLGAVLTAVAVAVALVMRPSTAAGTLRVDLRVGRYGQMWVADVASLALVLVAVALARNLTSRCVTLTSGCGRPAGTAAVGALGRVSRASVTLMFVHMAVIRSPLLEAVGMPPGLLRAATKGVLSLCVPLALHSALLRLRWTRSVLLGGRSC